MEAQGSVLTNKYAEGYPGRRWYGGCENVDVVEQLAIDRAKELFGAEHANVQPHSGSQANMAVYFAVLKPGDKIFTMDLAHGGHLTHGHKANFSGRFYDVTHYGVSKEDERIDYDELEKTARELKPALITVGASRLPARHRFRAHGQARPRDRRLPIRGHGAHRRPRRRRAPSEPGPARRFRHLHHPQVPARPARRHHSMQGGVREKNRLTGVPRHPGRSAHARHRRQGRLLRRGAQTGVQGLLRAGHQERPSHGRAPRRNTASASARAAPTTT